MAELIHISESPYVWGFKITQYKNCIYTDAIQIPKLIHFKKSGIYFTVNQSKILAIVIDGSRNTQIDFDSVDQMVEYFRFIEATNDFSQFKAWCNKCLLKASDYKSIALYQVLFKGGSNQPKHNESNALSVKQQTELAFEVR